MNLTCNIKLQIVIFNIKLQSVIFNIKLQSVIFNIKLQIVIFNIKLLIVIFNIKLQIVIFNGTCTACMHVREILKMLTRHYEKFNHLKLFSRDELKL